MQDYSKNLRPVDTDERKRKITQSVEERIRVELEKVRKLEGVRIEGRNVFVPFHLSGLNPVQFLMRNGFVVRSI